MKKNPCEGTLENLFSKLPCAAFASGSMAQNCPRQIAAKSDLTKKGMIMRMKRILSLTLVLVLLLVPMLSGCAHVGTEEEVLSAARELFPKVEVLNQIYYGSGIPAESGTENYRPALSSWLSERGITDLGSLERETQKVFSAALWEDISETILNPLHDVNGMVQRSVRYYEANTAERGAFIMVNTGFSPMIRGDNRFLTDSLQVVSLGKDIAVVKIRVVAYVGEQEKTQEVEYDLVWEEDAWRLDSIPCVSYID